MTDDVRVNRCFACRAFTANQVQEHMSEIRFDNGKSTYVTGEFVLCDLCDAYWSRQYQQYLIDNNAEVRRSNARHLCVSCGEFRMYGSRLCSTCESKLWTGFPIPIGKTREMQWCFRKQEDGKLLWTLVNRSRSELHTSDRGGHVYLLKAEHGYYKIGKAKSDKRRVAQIEPAVPIEIEHLHSIECVDRHQTETWLHKRFQSKRLKGEWFALTPDDVHWITRIDRLLVGELSLQDTAVCQRWGGLHWTHLLSGGHAMTSNRPAKPSRHAVTWHQVKSFQYSDPN